MTINGNAHGFVLKGIPNNSKGRQTIRMIREHLNRDRFDIRVRSNGKRVEPAVAQGLHPTRYFQDLPIEHAETFRVYFHDDATFRAHYAALAAERARTAAAMEARDHNGVALMCVEANLNGQVRALQADLQRARSDNADMAAELATIPAWVQRLSAWIAKAKRRATLNAATQWRELS